MQVRVLPEDFITAFRLHQRPRPFIAALGWLIAVMFVAAIALSAWSFSRGTAKWHDLLGPVAAVYLAGWYWWFIPARLRKLHAQQKVFHEPMEVEVRPDGLFFSHGHGAGLLPWAHVHKWRESKDILLVYHSDALYNALPKRELSPSEIGQIREALLQHVGPANNSSKPTPLRGAA